MTDRYFAQDIRNDVITRLQNATNGFNYYIAIINTERTHITPLAASITYKWGQNQFPFLLVEIESSEVLYDDPATPISLHLQNLPEVYELKVTGFLKYNDDNIWNWIEDWKEAVIRSLHNYNTSEISWIALTGTENIDLYNNENQNLKIFTVNFEARIN